MACLNCLNCKKPIGELDASAMRSELRDHGIIGAMADRFISDGILCHPCASYQRARNNFIESCGGDL